MKGDVDLGYKLKFGPDGWDGMDALNSSILAEDDSKSNAQSINAETQHPARWKPTFVSVNLKIWIANDSFALFFFKKIPI
jgi:hypothetical protein